MIKRLETLDPQSCLNRAHENEMIFVLLARDEAAPAAIRFWTKERIRLGKNKPEDRQIQNAEACAQEMERQLRLKRSTEKLEARDYQPKKKRRTTSR